MDLKQILKNTEHILRHYGGHNQIARTVEELCELIIELNGHVIESRPKERLQDEIADVLIMCLQMAQLFGLDGVRQRIEFKLDRQNKRILAHINRVEDNIGVGE